MGEPRTGRCDGGGDVDGDHHEEEDRADNLGEGEDLVWVRGWGLGVRG